MKGKILLLSLLAVMLGLATTVSAQQGVNSDKVTYMEKARVNQVSGEIDPADVLDARAQLEKMSSNKALNLNWIEAGPDNYGGFVSSILVDHQDESGNTIYAGAFTGGLWKTTNGGLIWEKINHSGQNIFVSSLAQANDGTIYASTGLKDQFVGQGVFKSTNGMDFELIPSTNPDHKNSDAAWSYVHNLEIGANQEVYAATNLGLMVSTNSGDSWTMAATNEGNLEGFCYDVEVAGSGVIFTTIEDEAYRSTGNIAEFNMISGSADSLLPSGAARIKFAAAPSEDAKVYAVAIDDDGILEGIFLSDNNGIEWREIGPGGTELLNPFFIDGDVGTGLNTASIAVAPNDADQVYVGGTVVFRGTAPEDDGYYAWEKPFFTPLLNGPLGINSICFPTNNKMYIASEYGVSSFNTSTQEYKTFNNFLDISSFNSVSLGIDDKVLGGENKFGILHFPLFGGQENTAETIIAGTGGYAERSSLKENNIIISLETSTSESMFRSQDMGEAFGQNFLKADIGYSGETEYVAQFLQFKLWESFNNPASEEVIYFKAIDTSYNAGDVVYAESYPEKYPIEVTLDANLNDGDSIAVNDYITSRLFVAAEDREAELWMTDEVHLYGVEPVWFQIAEFGDDELPSTIEVSKDGDYVYVGMENGALYRVGNVLQANDSASAMFDSGSSVVTNDTVFYMEDRMITSVSVDPNNNDHVVVTMGNYGNESYVYESFNASAENPVYNSIQYNLPSVPIYSSLVEMNSSDRVLVGSEFGIFALENDSWALEAGEMGALPVMQISQQVLESDDINVPVGQLGGETIYETFKGISNNGTIYASTYGRGIWKSRNFVGFDDIAEGNTDNQPLINVYPNPVSDIAKINLNDLTAEKADVRILDLQGRVVFAKPFNNVENEISLNVSFLKRGQYLVQVVDEEKVFTTKMIIR